MLFVSNAFVLIASFYSEQIFASSYIFSKTKVPGYRRFVSSECFLLHTQFPYNPLSNTSMAYFADHLNTCVHFVLLVDSSIYQISNNCFEFFGVFICLHTVVITLFESSGNRVAFISKSSCTVTGHKYRLLLSMRM